MRSTVKLSAAQWNALLRYEMDGRYFDEIYRIAPGQRWTHRPRP